MFKDVFGLESLRFHISKRTIPPEKMVLLNRHGLKLIESWNSTCTNGNLTSKDKNSIEDKMRKDSRAKQI